MTLTGLQLGLYALGMAGLWAVPGPVWVALLARTLSGGFASAWPLAVGVTLGDCLWPALAIFGMGWVLGLYGDALVVLRWGAAVVFALMGVMLIRKSGALMGADSKLTKPGRLAGFLVGVAAVIGNPKAILFYMSVLPGFFGDLSKLQALDITAILAISVAVPLVGNLVLALFLDRVRTLLAAPERVQMLNRASGALLILVACVIPFV
ncbi:LysE family translocator [Rhodobacter sp. KR11]|uniref:LysE family translocator n=1 Tax=Rhodobacter sp. KR11 TaxID=2974588 RepID=UPI002222FDE2|nr:LysE family translocator [Rhodobacter sp. KR11]MCW1919217.1 LysE family translocator [Rhodobacter sp. KR11]